MIDLPALRRRVIEELRKEWPELDDFQKLYAHRWALEGIHYLELGIQRKRITDIDRSEDCCVTARERVSIAGSDAWAWLPVVVEDARREVEENT